MRTGLTIGPSKTNLQIRLLNGNLELQGGLGKLGHRSFKF